MTALMIDVGCGPAMPVVVAVDTLVGRAAREEADRISRGGVASPVALIQRRTADSLPADVIMEGAHR